MSEPEECSHKELMLRMRIVEQKVDRNSQNIEAMHDLLVRYKGFLGGILFVSAGLWAIAVFLKTWLIKLLVGG